LTRVVESTTISNGLGWSPDGRRMYFIDSPTRRVDAFDYEPEDGTASARRPLFDTSAFPGVPDGLAVDDDGCLWVAMYGGGVVLRLSPDGRHVGTVNMPVAKPTSCCFAGPALDRLVITSARDADGSGGDLFVWDPGVAGSRTVPFAVAEEGDGGMSSLRCRADADPAVHYGPRLWPSRREAGEGIRDRIGAPTACLERLLAQDRVAHQALARREQRLRREALGPRVDEGERRGLVLDREREAGQDPSREVRRPDAVARVAEAVVRPAAGERPEEREVPGRDVDPPHAASSRRRRTRGTSTRRGRPPRLVAERASIRPKRHAPPPNRDRSGVVRR
jgi:hypothetical protein